MYNFKKVKNGGRPQEFSHAHFRRGAFDELGLIQRKKVLPKGLRPHRFENVSDTNQRLESLQQKLEDLLDQNRLLITTNKRFMAKVNGKNRYYSVKERKLLLLCILMGSKLIKVEEIKTLLQEYGIRAPETNYEIFDCVAQCYKREIDTENGDPDFIDELINTALFQLTPESKTAKSIGSRVRSILDKTQIGSDFLQNCLVPKTAFAFHFPKKRSASQKSEQNDSFRDNCNFADLDDNVNQDIAKKLTSPAYSDYKMELSPSEYYEGSEPYHTNQIVN